MLLAVDIGNTAIKFGVFDADSLIFKLSIPTVRDLTGDGLAYVLRPRLTQHITAAIVSSVVPEADQAVRDFIRSQYNVHAVFVANDWDFGLKINYEPLAEAGTDRITNTFSAVEKYGVPVIVCSFGTALAIDVVDPNRTLVGGVIAPGMQTLSAALQSTTSKLPRVEISKPEKVLQRTTIESIQSGIVYGYFGLVEELLTKIKREIADEPKVVATGGFARLIAENTTQITIIDENLLLDGLRMLHAKTQTA
ncbi:MAG: type III pantothenate kinase [Acidobacteriota bacterium]